jgi:aminopeptidase N
MWTDARPSSHPIVVPNITDVVQITSLFDSITYAKGSSILRMLELTAGSDRFADALREYILINAFDVGDPTVFYNKLFPNNTGEAYMKSWLQEMNYPLLNVKLTLDNGDTKVFFTQSRFILSDALNVSQLNPNYRWEIHITCVLGGNASDSDATDLGGDIIEFILEEEQDTEIVPDKSYTWIKCNSDFEGYYATSYDFGNITWPRFLNVIQAEADVSVQCHDQIDSFSSLRLVLLRQR